MLRMFFLAFSLVHKSTVAARYKTRTVEFSCTVLPIIILDLNENKIWKDEIQSTSF